MLQVSAAQLYVTYPFVLSWSMVEAMAAWCLVIGSRTAPVEEVLQGHRDGLLVDFFDSAAWVDAIGDALTRASEMRPLRAAARRTVLDQFALKRQCLPSSLELVRSMLPG